MLILLGKGAMQMRKFFYSISVLLFLCIVSMAYYGTYGLAEKRNTESEQQEQTMEETDAALVSSQEEGGYGKYYLKESDGFVIVYKEDKQTVFETTGISLDTLPDSLQEEIKAGKYVKSEKELYSFLENYSS